MTYLYNDPAKFADELVEGYVAAHRDKIYPVERGVIRKHKAQHGQVVVVVGGGSGHYPAFGGFVGQGMAHGAAMGNVFAAPSAQQICSVAQAVEAGGGILFCYGNYAGDVLNFNQAQDRLREKGMDVQSVVVTDDIASATITKQHERRGIAGILPVFKAAAIAADSGKSLNEVYRIAIEANSRVRSLGVAFSGCTLPGASQPLFDIARGQMDIGMGIHGEPGLYRANAPTADGLAEILVRKLLSEVPDVVDNAESARVGVILNSLGSVRHEELFVVYRRVDQLLTEKGMTIVEPLVGDYITSFDMAGISLTLFWLNDELEETWMAAADTPAFHRGHNLQSDSESEERNAARHECMRRLRIGSADSQTAAAVVLAAFYAAKEVIDAQQEELGRLDAVAGDGDHGIGMQRGLTAAAAAAQEASAAKAGAGTLLTIAAEAWSDRAGGTSGVLWGVILRNLGNAIGDEVMPVASTINEGLIAALHEVAQLGKAKPGDKTLVDVLQPFSTAFAAEISRGLSVADAWTVAAKVAEEAAQATQNLVPKIGRARPHAEKVLVHLIQALFRWLWFFVLRDKQLTHIATRRLPGNNNRSKGEAG